MELQSPYFVSRLGTHPGPGEELLRPSPCGGPWGSPRPPSLPLTHWKAPQDPHVVVPMAELYYSEGTQPAFVRGVPAQASAAAARGGHPVLLRQPRSMCLPKDARWRLRFSWAWPLLLLTFQTRGRKQVSASIRRLVCKAGTGATPHQAGNGGSSFSPGFPESSQGPALQERQGLLRRAGSGGCVNPFGTGGGKGQGLGRQRPQSCALSP